MGSERLAAVLGADTASTFDNPEETKLGFCKRIEEIMIGEDKVIKFSGCAQGEACTIVLRGASQHILDEAERSLHDALAVLYQTVQDSRVVYGGGAMEMAMANAVMQKLPEVEGKESSAVEAFAKALQGLPAILADNGGYDSAELLGKLKASHARGEHTDSILQRALWGTWLSLAFSSLSEAKSRNCAQQQRLPSRSSASMTSLRMLRGNEMGECRPPTCSDAGSLQIGWHCCD